MHLVHTQEEAPAGDGGIDGEGLEAARAVVSDHLDRLAATTFRPRARSCCTRPTTARRDG